MHNDNRTDNQTLQCLQVKRVSFTFIIHVLADDFFNIFYRNKRFRIT